MDRRHRGSRLYAKLDARRWALLRLRVFERDGWRCRKCGGGGPVTGRAERRPRMDRTGHRTLRMRGGAKADPAGTASEGEVRTSESAVDTRASAWASPGERICGARRESANVRGTLKSAQALGLRPGATRPMRRTRSNTEIDCRDPAHPVRVLRCPAKEVRVRTPLWNSCHTFRIWRRVSARGSICWRRDGRGHGAPGGNRTLIYGVASADLTIRSPGRYSSSYSAAIFPRAVRPSGFLSPRITYSHGRLEWETPRL